MKTNRELTVLLIFCLNVLVAFGQQPIRKGQTFCAINESGSGGEKNVDFTPADAAIEATIARIMSHQGLPQNFTVRAYFTFNAEARIVEESGESKRYILYNSGFLKQLETASGSEWGPIGIMAHEVAHHLLGHMIEHSYTNPALELEADHFAGFILCKMDATLEQTLSGFSVFSDVVAPDSAHPRRALRLEAVKKGWDEGKTRGGGGGGEQTASEKLRQFTIAAQKNDVTTVKAMLAEGLSVDSTDKFGYSALLSAVMSNAADTVELLLQRGANPNLSNSRINTSPLEYAIKKNSTRIIRLLLDHHVDVNARNNEGYTAFTRVLRADSSFKVTAETIALLVAAGADVGQDMGPPIHLTPLHFAVREKLYEVVKELLKSRTVRVNASDYEGWTPMDMATPSSEIEELLRRAGGKRVKNGY